MIVLAIVAVGGAIALLAVDDPETLPAHERRAIAPVELRDRTDPPVVRGAPPDKATAPVEAPQALDDAAPPAPARQIEPAGMTESELALAELQERIDVSAWPLDPGGVMGAVREVTPAIQECYQEALAEQPDLAGRMTIEFSVGNVDGVGQVTNAQVKDDTVAIESLSECARRAMSALQFDAPSGGTNNISYPLVFRPE